MMARARLWWTGRTTREQRLLLAMFALLGVTIAWVIVLTIGNAVGAARTRHGEAVIAHAEVAGKVDALRDLQRGRVATVAAVDAAVSQAASEAGFVLSRSEAQGDGRVLVAIGSARPQAFFGWVGELEARGIFPERLTARANSDRTLNIEAVFRTRGTP